MPVDSTQINQIISQQQASASQSNAYAQQIGASVMSHTGSANFAGNVAATAIGGAEMIAGGVSFAADVGVAPAVLSPWSGTFEAMRAAHSAGGASAAIGAGLVTGGAYFAVGAIASKITEQTMLGAQQQSILSSMAASSYGQSGLAPTMGSLNDGIIRGMTNTVFGAAGAGMGSVQELSSVFQGGMMSGAFSGASNISEFRSKFSELVRDVREVATAMKMSMTEAQSVMSEVNNLGVSSADAGGFLTGMRGSGIVSGMSPAESMQYAAYGSQTFRGMGLSGGVGAQVMSQGAAMMGFMGRSGIIDEGTFGDIGGIGSSQRYMNAALRTLGSGRGRKILGAAIGDDGELDENIVSQIAAGQLSRSDINKLYASNINSAARREDLMSRQSELAGQFLELSGPTGVGGVLEGMFGGASNEDFMKQAFSGLTRRDVNVLDKLAAAGPQMKMKMMQQAKRALQTSAGGEDVGSIVDKIIDDLTGGEWFQKFQGVGRAITESAQSAINSVMSGVRGGSSQLTGTGSIDKFMTMSAMGSGPMYMQSMDIPTGGSGMASLSMTPSGYSFIPRAVDIVSEGERLSDYPMHGLMSRGSSSGMAAYGLAGTAAFAYGRAFGTGSVGGAISSLGRSVAGVGDTGNMGRAFPQLRGTGIGTGRAMVGTGLRMAGWATRGVGMAFRATGIAALSYSLATDLGPRAFGLSSGVHGDRKTAVEVASGLGFLSEDNSDLSSSPEGNVQIGDSDSYLTPIGQNRFMRAHLSMGDIDPRTAALAYRSNASKIAAAGAAAPDDASRYLAEVGAFRDILSQSGGGEVSLQQAAGALDNATGGRIGGILRRGQKADITFASKDEFRESARSRIFGNGSEIPADLQNLISDKLVGVAGGFRSGADLVSSHGYTALSDTFRHGSASDIAKVLGLNKKLDSDALPGIRTLGVGMLRGGKSNPYLANSIVGLARSKRGMDFTDDIQASAGDIQKSVAAIRRFGPMSAIVGNAGFSSSGLEGALEGYVSAMSNITPGVDPESGVEAIGEAAAMLNSVKMEAAKGSAEQVRNLAGIFQNMFEHDGGDVAGQVSSMLYGVADNKSRFGKYVGGNEASRLGFLREALGGGSEVNRLLTPSLLSQRSAKELKDSFKNGFFPPSLTEALIATRTAQLARVEIDQTTVAAKAQQEIAQLTETALKPGGPTDADIANLSLGLENMLGVTQKGGKSSNFNKEVDDVITGLKNLRRQLDSMAGGKTFAGEDDRK
jgi:hypothetical protein